MIIQDKDSAFFDEILSAAMNDIGLGCVGLEEILKDRGISISFKSISAYMKGIRVPQYERAKLILEILDVEIKEKDLIELLERTREKIKMQNNYIKQDEKEIRKTITIRLKTKNISPELSAGEGLRILEERIKGMFGDESKFSDYVKHLIIKDLREFILETNDIITEEDNSYGNQSYFRY